MFTNKNILIDALFNKKNRHVDYNIYGCKYIDEKVDTTLPHFMINSINRITKPITENINVQTSKGYTTLMILCDNFRLEDYYDTIKYLLDNKADPNIKNNDGETALFFAIHVGKKCDWGFCRPDLRIIKLLLDHGVDKTVINNSGNNIFDDFLYDINLKASGIDHNMEVAKLLIDNMSKNSMYSALRHCNKNDNYGLPLIKLMLDNNCDISNETIKGQIISYPGCSEIFAEMSCCNKTHYNNGSFNIAVERHPDYMDLLLNSNITKNINVIEDALCIAVNKMRNSNNNNNENYIAVANMLMKYIDNYNMVNNIKTNRLIAKNNLQVLVDSPDFAKFICNGNNIIEDNRFVQCIQRYYNGTSRMDLIPVLEFTKKYLLGNEINIFVDFIKTKLMKTYPNFTKLDQFV